MVSTLRRATRGQEWWTVLVALGVAASWFGVSGVALLR